MNTMLSDFRHEFLRHKMLADRAIAALDDAEFFRRPGSEVNPTALIVKHLAGNMVSRWTDFLTTDGEKPSRDRDGEFLLTQDDSRETLLEKWERAWAVLFATLTDLRDADLEKSVTIRAEEQTARQALLRGMTHVAYHTGQLLYLARMFRPQSPWLTIPPGKSRGYPGNYRQK